MRLFISAPLIVLLVLTIFTGCSSRSASTPPGVMPHPASPTATITFPSYSTATDTASPQLTYTATVTPRPSPRTESAALENTQYTLSATLDYWGHHLAVDEQIAYTNHSPEAIQYLVLIIEPIRYPDTFRLVNLAWGDGQPVEDYTFDLGSLKFPLPEPLPPGESLQLSLSYKLNLPSPSPSYYGRPIPFGYSARQTNLVDWYPFIPPYVSGKGWLVHQGWVFGEHLVYEAADFMVNIRLAGSSSPLTIAASAPAESDGDWQRYRLDSARTFAWSVSHEYEIETAQVGATTLLSYAFPVNAAAGAAALQVTAEALALYNELFGPYPRQSLSVVEADFLDGMEFDGLYFLSKGFYNLSSGTPADYLTTIAAHETAHQWWYGLVGNDQALEPWLDEALCTYSERLYFERLHPEALDWWWEYRIDYYQPSGWVDSSIYNPEGYRAYRDAVYLNGALFLEDLRKLVGDEVFFAFLPDYATSNAHRLATAGDFFALMEKHSQEDLTSLLERYFKEHFPQPAQN